MEKKRQITLGGIPGAGKTSCGKKIADLLGFNFYSAGDFRRKLADEEFAVDINTLNALEEAKLELKGINISELRDMELLGEVEHLDLEEKHLKSLRKIMNIDTDIRADNFQKEFGIKGNNFVIEGRLAWKFCPDSFSVYLNCDPEVAAERILMNNRPTERNFHSIEEAKDANLRRMESDRKRYLEKYGKGYDCYNPKNFHLIIDTTNITREEVIEQILKAFDIHCDEIKLEEHEVLKENISS